MSKVLNRIEELIDEGAWTYANAVAIASAEQLERIADALEKQNVGNQMVQVDGRVFGKLVDDCGKFIPEDSNGPCKPGPSQRCSP